MRSFCPQVGPAYALISVLEPGVVGLAGNLLRQGLLAGGVPGAGVGLSGEFPDPGDELLGPPPVVLPAGGEVGLAGETAEHLVSYGAGLVSEGVEPPEEPACDVVLAHARPVLPELGSPLSEEFLGCPRVLEEVEEAGLGFDEPGDRLDEEFQDVGWVAIGAIEGEVGHGSVEWGRG